MLFNGCLASDKILVMLQLIFWLSGIFSKKKFRAVERFSKTRREKQTTALQFEYEAHQGQIDIDCHQRWWSRVQARILFGAAESTWSHAMGMSYIWSAYTSMMIDYSIYGCFCLFWKWSLIQHQDPHDVDRWLHGCRGLGYHTSAWSSTWGQNSHQWLNPLSPIKYGEWHQLFIDMRDRYVAMVLWSYQGPCVRKTESRGWLGNKLAKAEGFGKQVQAEDWQKVKFGKSGFLLVNTEFFALIQTLFDIRSGFKPSTGQGALLLMGNPVDLDFVNLELVKRFIV